MGLMKMMEDEHPLPIYPGIRHTEPVPDPKTLSCIRPRVPISGVDAGAAWYNKGRQYVIDQRQTLEKTSIDNVPTSLKAHYWIQESDSVRSFEHDVVHGVQETIAFEVARRNLKQLNDSRSSRSAIKHYKAFSRSELSCRIPQSDMPTYQIDGASRAHRTRPQNNSRPIDGPDAEVRADHVIGIFASDIPDFTREDIWSSKARVISVIEFKRWGMVDAERFRHGIESLERTVKRGLPFDQDCMNLLDQVAAYAIVWNTPSVAICDGETVILIDFDENILHPNSEPERV